MVERPAGFVNIKIHIIFKLFDKESDSWKQLIWKQKYESQRSLNYFVQAPLIKKKKKKNVPWVNIIKVIILYQDDFTVMEA